MKGAVGNKSSREHEKSVKIELLLSFSPNLSSA